MIPPAGQLFNVVMDDGCALACRQDGPEDAQPLLLSGSLGCAMALWDDQVEAMAGRFRVIRYDPRGHGRSDAPTGAYGIDRLARDAVAVLDVLGVERAAFCGISMGGMVGQRLGVVAPERLTRLVLACTSANMGPPSGWTDRIAAVMRGGMGAVADSVLDRWFSPEFRAADKGAVERLRDMLLATSPVGYAGCCAALRDMDQRATARLIAVPVLVITGARDPATPPEHGRFLAEQIPGAVHHELATAHLANVEHPAGFNTALLDFLI